jgi:hypothetical protein
VDVHIGEMHSTVRAVDGESLVSPEVMDRLVRATLARIDEQGQRRRQADDDTMLRPAPDAGRGGGA